MLRFFCCVTVLLGSQLGGLHVASVAPPNSIPMVVINHADSPIELFWIDTFSNKDKSNPTLVPQTEKALRNGSDASINSYVGHSFRVKFHESKPTAKYADFTKGPKEEKVYVSFDGSEIKLRQVTRFDEAVQDFKEGISRCGNPNRDGYSECLVDSVYRKTQNIVDQTNEITKYRDLMSERLRNYTCADANMKTTNSTASKPISFKGKRMMREILLDKPTAKIWYVEDFISQEECDILRKHGKPRLSRATVAAADGSSVVSENRKANQAHYDIQKHGDQDPLWPLYERVLYVTNSHAGYNLRPEGQEDYTIIQYNTEDEYTPHCDGACDSSDHVPGGRIATAVMYCEVPKVGGATTFTKADIFVKPKVGMATFFSYMGPDEKMDYGLTEHSGCPVIEGEKWITTAWMRKGVSAQDPWNLFDPSGGRLSTEALEKEGIGRELKVNYHKSKPIKEL